MRARRAETGNERSWVRIAAIVASALAVSSCSMAGTVKSRAAYDLKCSESQIDVKNIGGNSYAASGCGRDQTYTCTRMLNSPASCSPDVKAR
jgi:hypothetical protein